MLRTAIIQATSHKPQATIISLENDKSHLIYPDFIYNRFDLWRGFDDCSKDTLHIKHSGKDYYVQVMYEKNFARLGIWLMDIPSEAVKEVAAYIFKKHRKVRWIYFQRSYTELGECSESNHFRMTLPATSEELYSRLTNKSRYNIKREQRLLEAETGGLVFAEYDVDNMPKDVFEAYFTMKKITHGRDFRLTEQEYIMTSQTSNAYVIRAAKTGKIISLVLSCEQCPIVYIENITYDIVYAKYSPGKMIYHHYLGELVKKGKKELFLSGGQLDYKRHYGSREETIYTGRVFRSVYACIMYHISRTFRDNMKKIVPVKLWKKLKYMLKA